MPSKYSSDFVATVRNNPQRGLGQKLALICVEANLPSAYVAQVLGVSRMTLHTWFRGGVIREKKHLKVQTLTDLMREDLAKGVLPVKTLSEARAYLQEMSDEPIRTLTSQEKD